MDYRPSELEKTFAERIDLGKCQISKDFLYSSTSCQKCRRPAVFATPADRHELAMLANISLGSSLAPIV